MASPASIARTRQSCEDALRQSDLSAVKSVLDRANVAAADCVRLTRSVTPAAASQQDVTALVARARDLGLVDELASVERRLVLETALASLRELPAVPVCDAVKELFCDEVESWTKLDDGGKKEFAVGRSRFVDMCKMASLRRFPAGQFDWDVSGLPWSYLARVAPLTLPRALYMTAVRLKGRAPIFFAHLSYRRRGQSLSEAEANRSYYRMARSLELQPAIKGLIASSWIRSPDTQRVSPHLSWLSRVFVENGGFVTTMGPADPSCGVFVRSEARRRLYERGEFTPTIGLVIWPRDAMIAWAKRHPELA